MKLFFRSVFCLFIAVISLIIYDVTIGRNPIGLKIGIYASESCSNSSTVIDSVSCNSFCHIVEFISDEIDEKIFYHNYENALHDLQKGKLSAILNLNFPSSFQKNNSTDVNQPKIQVELDQTCLFTKLFVEGIILDAYRNFTNWAMSKCNGSLKFHDIPLEIMKPIYGKSEIDIRSNNGPIVILTNMFFACAANTIAIFLCDRINGSWNRDLITGVSTFELIFAHFVVNFFIGIFQMIISLTLMFSYYPQTWHSDVFLLTLLLLFVVICGILFGITLSCSLDSLSTTGQVGNLIGFTNLLTSGNIIEIIQFHDI